MYSPTLVLLLSYYLLYVNCAAPQCCPGENILIIENSTCRDGSNVTVLFCDTISFVGSTQEPSRNFQVDENDDNLFVTSGQNMEFLKINPDKYCLTNNSIDNAEIAMICNEHKQTIILSTKGIILISLKATCAVITVLFLLAVLVIYLSIPDLRDIEGYTVVNFTLFLCAAHVALISVPVAEHFASHACNTTSFLYFMLYISSYNWLCVISFHLWRIAIQPVFRPHIRWFLLYCCYGYGIPLILLTTALTLHYTQDVKLQETTDLQCWVDGSRLVWGYFYGATMVTSLISITLQFWVAKKLWMGDGKTDNSQSAIRLRKKALRYLHLLLIMVLVKIVDIITFVYLEKHSYLNYLWQFSECRNALLGGVIFFILVVQRKKVLKALAKRDLFCIEFPQKWKKLVDEENEKEQSTISAATQNNSSL